MLHTNNDKVRSLLLKGNFGLENESLRITRDGNFALSLHPFPDTPNIVYDFCENQTEINTDVAPSAEEAQKLLAFHTRQIHQKLVSMDEPEYMWPFSNPPFIPNERDIPIAHHNIKAEYSEGYREYLANRYGRYMMSLSGIHVNYSFSDELLKADFDLSESDNFEEYKNSVYLGLAAGLAAYGWIVTALTAASPLLDGSFLERGKRGITAHNKVNFMLYDGSMLYVHDNLKGSLFVHHFERSLIFATTPLNKEKWEPVEPCRLQAYKNGRHVLSGTAHQNEYIENPEDMRLIFLDYAQL